MRAELLGVAYASDDWSPLSDITLGLLLKRAGVQWRYAALDGLAEIVWPPVCGVYLLQLERAQPPAEKRLAVRHGLGHVLGGDVADLAFSHDGHECFGHEERVADLFALVDLVPDRELAALRAAHYTFDEQRWWLTCELKRYASGWSDERIRDRVALRLAAARAL